MRISTNLAVGSLALQSSFSHYSGKDDPLGAVSGTKTGLYGFHTEHEESPWWMLDLGAPFALERIVVYNRCDAAPDRARRMTISLREDTDPAWYEIYRAENVFGGLPDSSPLVINFGLEPITARFVKVQLFSAGFLHLDEVEVFGTDPSARYREHIAALVSESAGDRQIAPTAKSSPPSGAIVVLTRGYDDPGAYEKLIQRNRAIHDTINAGRATQYPLLIFHEGNIPPHHQDHIRRHEHNADLRFIDISEIFKIPPTLDTRDFVESWPTGYLLMCRFHALDIWALVAEYDYILRIDEDCILESVSLDPFTWARDNAIDYAPAAFVGENHHLTTRTLPVFIKGFLDSKGHAAAVADVFNQRFPYTNLGIARTRFFLEGPVHEFLECVTSEADFYRNRWGDLPIIGCALNMFSTRRRTRVIPGLSYRHGSHDVTIRSLEDEVAAQEPTAFDSVAESPADLELERRLRSFVNALDFPGAERILLDAIVDRPSSAFVRVKLTLVTRALGRRLIAAKLSRTIASARSSSAEMMVGDTLIGASSGTDEFYAAYFRSPARKNIIQVGANDGVMCDPLRPFLVSTPEDDVSATLIEPVPFYFEKLRELYRGSAHIALLNLACGAEPGSLPLYFIAPEVANEMNGTGPANDWAHGQGSFDRDTVVFWIDQNKFRGDLYVANLERYYDAIKSIDVQVTPLRDVPAAEDNENLLVVIDAQGHEIDVMRGMDWSRPPAFIVFEDDLKRESTLTDTFLQLNGFKYLCGDNDKVYARGRA